MDLKDEQMGVIISFFSDEEILAESKEKTEQKQKRRRFYKGKEGPEFVLLDYNKIYETRKYSRMLWVSVQEKDDSIPFEKSVKISSQKLKMYLNGANSKKLRMGVTCPLICKSTMIDDSGKIFSMVIPSDYSENPPAPISQDLFLEEQASKIVYVGVIKGAVIQKEWNCKMEGMIDALKYNNETFEEDSYRIALYNDNLKDKRGYWEIWVNGVKTEQEYVCLRNDEEEDAGE